ncbi:MAG TPA: exosortase A [Rubrivivax sp.]|nr:exosortase A [Rubrivivax sp.]
MSAVLADKKDAAAWQRLLPLLLLLAATLLLFRDTAAAMAAIWLRSDTFAHCMLVPPISLWLVWRRRARLAALRPQPMPWLLLPLAAACLLWLLGELATVGAASQLALVTLIVLSVPAVYGWAITRELLFPLAFLYFSVPLGEFLVPTLIDHTADFTVAALRLSGIPVYREGNEFVIPSGNWSVVEACSGVRYLIASFMVGTLFAYLNYASWKRRLAFMAVSIVVPIIANWLRAYMIVMIGHLSGNKLAVGVDHLIYGWVFFGIVIGLMFWIGARWSEPERQAAALPAAPAAGAAAQRSAWPMVAGIVLLMAGAQAWWWRLDHPEALPPPALSLPSAPPGWSAADAAMPWPPGFVNPSATAFSAQDLEGRRVWLWVGYYRQQNEERKLVSSINRIAAEDKGWAQAGSGLRPAADGLPAWQRFELRRGQGLETVSSSRLEVWQQYWIGGRWTTSGVRVKLWQAMDRLLGRGDDGAVVLLATAADGHADALLQKFAQARLGAIGAALQEVRDGRSQPLRP